MILKAGGRWGKSSADKKPVADLDILEGVGHHGDEHVEEKNDGHEVVGHEQQLGDGLREVLAVLDLDAGGSGQ